MEIKRVDAKTYKQYFPNPFSLFNGVEFTELNKKKCMDIHYLVFKDTKIRLGIILGEKDTSMNTPFSASYGGFSYNAIVGLQYYYEACALLKKYAEGLGKKVYITLAPPIYDNSSNSKTFKAFMAAGAEVSMVEYNHHMELGGFSNYEIMLDSKVRNKLRNSMNSGLNFKKLNSSDSNDVARAYEVIKINHLERKHPLNMSLQNVLDTIKIIPADFFIASTKEGVDVASAQIFHANKDIYQIVYWGDVPAYSYLKSMNFLSYKVFEYYYSIGIKMLDIGISTEGGVPNYGLCEFKENIGCVATLRFSLVL